MNYLRLYAGAAVAALVATSAFAQTATTGGMSAGMQPQGATPSGAMQGGMTPGETAPGGGMTGMAPQGAPAAGGAFTPITPSPSSNIIQELTASGQFGTLLSVLATTNLTSLVATHPNITLIAPTDAAFAALPPGQLDTLKKNPQQLQALLTYHLIGAKIAESDVKGHAAGQVQTVANKQVTIDGTATPIKINDASVLQGGVTASNGVIWVVDKVLTPPA
jgi:hypothetical protein